MPSCRCSSGSPAIWCVPMSKAGRATIWTRIRRAGFRSTRKPARPCLSEAMKSLVLALALAALSGTAQAQSLLTRGNGAEPDSLDPHFVGGLAEENILDDLMVGLTALDAAGRPIPGIALNWTTAPDGLTWTFHLRAAAWSDGKPVTAGDFVFAWRRLLDPKTASRYAANLWILKHAQAVSEGKMPPQALGVSAPKPDTLVLTLEHAAPYLPELLTHPSAL